MSFFKKVIFSLIAGIIFLAAPASAQYGLQETVRKTPYDQKVEINSMIEKVVAGALATLAIIFFGLALYSGVRWMTARGDEAFVEKAKDTLRAAVIGLVIVLGAYALTRFVFLQLNNSGQALSSPASPSST